jgi:hypothetical protein
MWDDARQRVRLSRPLPTPVPGPPRGDLDSSPPSRQIMPATGPLPVLWVDHQSSRHWVAMEILQLLHALPLGTHIEVVITALPERPRCRLASHRDLDRLKGRGQHRALRFCDQEMHMLGHHHVADYQEAVSLPHRLKRTLKQHAGGGTVQQRPPLIATEGHEVLTACLLIPNKASGHASRFRPSRGHVKITSGPWTEKRFAGARYPTSANGGQKWGTRRSDYPAGGCRAGGTPQRPSRQPKRLHASCPATCHLVPETCT